MVTLVSLRAYRRFPLVVYRFLPLIWAYLRDRKRFVVLGGSREVTHEMRLKRAEVLLDTLLTLGPTFIKLGQILSTRPDVLPASYIEVLSSLQDDVPPAPWAESRHVIEDELGPIEEVFDEFDTDPISGASLGQVYVATYEGQEVAVKVRRPGIEELVEADLRIIKWSLPLLSRFVGQGQAFSLDNLAEEFDKTIHQEMDYSREQRVLREIRANFEDSDRIVIPEPVAAASGPRVLTMEYIPGTKISDTAALDAMGIDRTELATTLQRAYLQMIAEDGVFHADPHPGNLSVTPEGKIIFYDFGMSGRVDPFIQEKIIDFYIAVANQDIDAILDALVEMGTLSPEADRKVMADVMELAIADVRGEDIEQYRVQQVIEQVESTIYDFPLRLPQNMALVLRVATVVEGVCVTLDPNFDFIEVATEYLSEEGYLEDTARRLAGDAADQTRDTARALFTVPPKLDDVLDTVQREDLAVNVTLEDDNDVLDRLAKRIAYSILTAVGGLSAAIIYSFGSELVDVYVSVVIIVATLPMVFFLYRSFTKNKRGIRAQPQFTRQSMKERQAADPGADESGSAGAMMPGAVTQTGGDASGDGSRRGDRERRGWDDGGGVAIGVSDERDGDS
ncbi:ABC1 kinase family protein [Halobaculum gomorrense]|uniref:Predicted unusual protein kinase regulating ubiquinone biosynthesis, AarF/ABC1/UbiB family n=1 Tax=Halobaculum gomorrense TaxID=43928 RepID=A0A1M5MPS4_9EURY|nr:Predicted unusual protein kinase regulating ubiquinone biosynthesis, AarF/ABC1/UbiB family [Halobaculum gomorrense]